MNIAAPAQSAQALLALGQARRPWDYLRAVAEADPEIADAPPVRFLLAANLGALGFADAAVGVLDELDRQRVAGLNTDALRSALAGKPATRLDRVNDEVWMTGDGACLWRESGRLIGCDAGRDADRVLAAVGLAPGRVPTEHLPPLLIAGLSTPVLLQRAIEATPPLANGFTPRILVVEPDSQRAERALAMMDGGIDPARIMIHAGTNALDGLAADLGERLGCALPRHVLRDPLVSAEFAEAVDGVLREASREQERQTDLMLGEVARHLQPAESAVARVREGRTLRVLLPVSRHSSFVRHSAQDLRAALERLGHAVRTLDEPDAHSTLSKLGYLRAAIEIDPDLILLINHPRWRLGDALPTGPVSASWVQDAMPHLFADAHRHHGERDFLVGYRFPELVERFGYRADRVIDAGIPVDPAKFHDGPVDPVLRERFTCDVAFATRQSETPQAMIERLLMESGGDRAARTILGHLRERIDRAIVDGSLALTVPQLEAFTTEALAEAGAPDPDRRRRDEILRLMVMPLADRVLRHRVLAWAAEVCAERGWSLALYGSGWEHHPTLSAFAKGELNHGEELRAAYQCAGVHLSVSAHSLVHQRVIECAMSGGRVLCYRRLVDLATMRHGLLSMLAGREPDAIDDDGSPLYRTSLNPSVAEHLERWQRLGRREGLRRGEAMRLKPEFLDHFRALAQPDPDEAAIRRTIIDRAGFTTREQFEAMLEHAVRHREDHERAMAPIRSVGAKHFSADAQIGRVLQAIAAALGGCVS